MKKSDLRVDHKIVQVTPGAGAGRAVKITDIYYENNILGMGAYGCRYDKVHEEHKFVREDGTLEEITND